MWSGLDVPGISVENQLALEDDFVPGAFALDCVVYAVATGLFFHLVRRSLRRGAA